MKQISNVKRGAVIIAILLLALQVNAQPCTITCINQKGSLITGIRFTIKVKEHVLESDKQGVLKIDKKIFAKYKNQFAEFTYYEGISIEFYTIPDFLANTKRRLYELCGVTLIAENRW